MWGYNVPRTFASCTLQGVLRNLHLTSALENSASCTVSYYKTIGGQETSPATLMFPISPNYLIVLLNDDDDDDNDVDE